MYIELFLLDNLLMNTLICLLAGAACGRRVKLRRAALFSLFGAVYGVFAVCFEPLMRLPCRIALCLAMALVFPYTGIREYVSGLAAIMAAAMTMGGLSFMLLYLGEARNMPVGGVPLRIMLLTAIMGALLPRAARALRRRRANGEGLTLMVRHGERVYTLAAMVDSGNGLYDPLSGLPVAVAWLPEETGEIPIPAGTVGGSGILYAFRPESAQLSGAETDILVAIARRPIRAALIPPAALPDELREERKEKNGV